MDRRAFIGSMLALPAIAKVDPAGLLQHPAEELIATLKAGIAQHRAMLAASPMPHTFFVLTVDKADYKLLKDYLGVAPNEEGYTHIQLDGVSVWEMSDPIDFTNGGWSTASCGTLIT